jgi:hypothetical protein
VDFSASTEDVAPDDRVSYITQGVLRLAFRKVALGDDSAYLR